MRSLEQPRQSREYLAKRMTKVFLLEDVQQQRRRVAALSTKSSASLILIQKLLSPDRGITYDLAHATAGCHGCSARHRPCCYTACSGNHFSDALWDACFVTFSDAVLEGRTESCHFHSSVVQSRIAPPQTSQRIQTPNAGVVIAEPVVRHFFVLVIALLSTELHEYFALCSLQPVRVVLIKARSKWRLIHPRGRHRTISMGTLAVCFFL